MRLGREWLSHSRESFWRELHSIVGVKKRSPNSLPSPFLWGGLILQRDHPDILYAVLSIAVIVPIAIFAVMSLVTNLLNLANPCFSWGASSAVVSTSPGACSSASSDSETILQMLTQLALINGGILVGGILGVLGFVTGRPLMLLIGSILLFGESAPLLFGGTFLFALLPAGFFLFLWASRSHHIFK